MVRVVGRGECGLVGAGGWGGGGKGGEGQGEFEEVGSRWEAVGRGAWRGGRSQA